MTIEVRIGGTLRNSRVSIPEDAEGFVTAAELGAVANGGVIIEDPDGDLTINGWQEFRVDDTLATPTRVFSGFIADRGIGRGGKYATGPGRVHNCTIMDQNALLATTLIRFIDNDGKRPFESDVDKLTWLLSSRALAGLVFDAGLVSTSGPVNLLASDERDKYALGIISSFAPVAAKNFFVYRDQGTGSPSLFYDHDSATVWPAGISISNDPDDTSSTCFYPSKDATMTRTPEYRYTAVEYQWRGDPIFAESAATLASLGMHREAIYSTDRVGHLATAQSESISWLNLHTKERDVIAVTLELPSASVNLAYAGQEIDVKFVHIPGYEDFVTTRIRRRDARPLTRGRWSVRFELYVPPTPATDGANGTPGDVVQQVSGYVSTGGALTLAAPVTAGGILICQLGIRNASAATQLAAIKETNSIGASRPFTPFTTDVEGVNYNTDSFNIGYREATGDEQTIYFVSGNDIIATYYELEGITAAAAAAATVISATDQGSSSAKNIGTLTSGTGHVAFMGTINKQDFDAGNYEVGALGWTEDFQRGTGGGADLHPHITHWHATGQTGSLSASESGANQNWGGIAVDLAGVGGGAGVPFTGSSVVNETAGGTIDASNMDFTTAYPFIEVPNLSLRVYHDGTDQTDHISAYDGTAGTFSLDYAPSFGSTITTSYTAA